MKLFFLQLIASLAFLACPSTSNAQNFKEGDMVYFRVWMADKEFYFSTTVYVIASVKSVIGSRVTLDTQQYLYQCSSKSKYWNMCPMIDIHRSGGLWYVNEYGDWYARNNRGYQWPIEEVKRYDSAAEKKITDGGIVQIHDYAPCTVYAKK